MIAARSIGWRASVLDCGSPLPLSHAGQAPILQTGAKTFRLVKLFLLLLILCISSLLTPASATPDQTTNEVFLFTSFRANGEDGLHLLSSQDAYHWVALNQDKTFLRPEIGHQIMRDPSLALGPDGAFHLVWTSGWTAEKGRIFGYARSKDLLRWSVQRAVPVMQDEPLARNIWAPELFYDDAKKQWLIFWSSTIPGRFAPSDHTGDDGYNHRVYCVATPDFERFSPTRLFYEPGFNIIDASMLQAGKKFILFFKDERKNPLQKKLRYAVAGQAEGPFGAASEPFTEQWVEGPSAIQVRGWTIVYFDHFAEPQHYGAVRSKDLKVWEDCSKEMSFPPGHRHGTVLRVPSPIAGRLPK